MTPSAASKVSPSGFAPMPVLAIVGAGLIGGSFAAALRRAGCVDRVVGVGRRRETLAQARGLGLIDAAVSAEEAAATADCIFLAAPVGAFEGILTTMRPHLRPGVILTDAGSTKVSVIAAARAALGEHIGQFVPGHPIAGTEKTGPQAADPDLFRERDVVLTPLAENRPADIERVRELWRRCGARVTDMDAAVHDRVLASVSHLPHLLSVAYMIQVAEASDASARLALAGSGFRDVTRIAAGSPEMWRDIFRANRPALLSELAGLREMIDRLENAIAADDAALLLDLLGQAASARRAWKG